MNGGIFLTVKDLMLIRGIDNYRSACREHCDLRAMIAKRVKKLNRKRYLKRHLTIKEYCNAEDLSFDEVWLYLRGKSKDEGDAG
ncbi:hypothetical protein BH11BAC7_BH11BAC7_21410 [soil metagenome]